MTLDILTSLILLATGLLAGGISAIAGGSAIISFPVLLSIGLPPVVANATNFTAVLPGNLAALPAYITELKQTRTMALQMVVVGLLGGALGSFLLLYTSNTHFKAMVPWLMLSATVLYVVGGRVAKWASAPSAGTDGL